MKCHDFSVIDFGAVGDGKTLNTIAFQAAVDACSASGGGRVVVPAGVFVSGPIFLQSNMEFHLSPGAVLKAVPDLEAYGEVDLKTHGHHINAFRASLITAVQAENVSVTGRGTLDGSGKLWWDEIDAGRRGPRPVLVYFLDCDRTLLEGVTLRDSAAWTVLPLLCRDVEIRGIKIKNPWMPYHNCDGIDIHSCRNVRVSDCILDTGDDGICLKSIPDWFISGTDNKTGGGDGGTVDYSRPCIPCENVTIENCTVLRAHSGVAIWAEVIGGLRNVTVTNCVFEGTRTGIQFQRYPYPGGYVRDVTISNIVMRRVEIGIQLSNKLDSWHTMNDGPDLETTPEFHNIRISNITGTQINAACIMHGMEKNPVHDIEFSHIRMEANLGFDISFAKNLRFDAIHLTCQNTPLVIKDCENVEIAGLNAKPSTPDISVVEVERVRDVWIHGCTAAPGTGVFLGTVGSDHDVLLEANRLGHAGQERAAVDADNRWNICSHAYNGSRWIRDSGETNKWLPLPEPVRAFVRDRWTAEERDGIYSVSRVEANARPGAEWDVPDERRRIYIVEAHGVAERLVLFEDGELLRTIVDPEFHAHIWKEGQ